MTEFFSKSHVRQVPFSQLSPGPWQPRKAYDREALAELTLSIKTQGVLTPLRVIRSSKSAGYLIVAGERRWRAAGLAGINLLPCLIIPQNVKEQRLRELAILDNFHRANLLPGEEARAVAKLHQLGLRQREIAERLGKSQSWISQRLAIAKLRDTVLTRLDSGAITREEALALAKLGKPRLIEACLEPDSTKLAQSLLGHVPQGISERVQAMLRALEMEGQKKAWVRKMRSNGHTVLDDVPEEKDTKYVKLAQGSDLAKAHQAARLGCEAWSWEYGRAVRYCTDPALLRRAMTKLDCPSPTERVRQEERRRVLERADVRDAVIQAWLATARRIGRQTLVMLARERVQTLAATPEHALARLGGWLGITGDRATRIAAVEQELAQASEQRFIQLWFALEVAQAASYSTIPGWVRPWLDSIGYVEPIGNHSCHSKVSATREAAKGNGGGKA